MLLAEVLYPWAQQEIMERKKVVLGISGYLQHRDMVFFPHEQPLHVYQMVVLELYHLIAEGSLCTLKYFPAVS